MIDNVHQCNCKCHCSKRSVKTNKEGDIVEIKNGKDTFILCNPAAKGIKFIPTIHNGKPIHITKDEAIKLLISAAAQNAYLTENVQ